MSEGTWAGKRGRGLGSPRLNRIVKVGLLLPSGCSDQLIALFPSVSMESCRCKTMEETLIIVMNDARLVFVFIFLRCCKMCEGFVLFPSCVMVIIKRACVYVRILKQVMSRIVWTGK